MTGREQQLFETLQRDAKEVAIHDRMSKSFGFIAADGSDEYDVESPTYFHDVECKACGTNRRFKKTNKCVTCSRREERAKKLADAGRYMADRPCLKCGTRERYVKNRCCCKCSIEYTRARRRKSRDH